MNQIWLDLIEVDTDYLEYGIRAIEQNDFSMKMEMYQGDLTLNSGDPWIEYENQRFLRSIGITCIGELGSYWSKILGVARRIKKLETKRIKNPNYCNKSEYNLTSIYENR